MQDPSAIFSRRLAIARKIMGLSQSQLGELSGINRLQIGRYEGGQEPDFVRLVRLADALGVSVDWLLGRDGQDAGGHDEP